ncbi:hypothetical protein MCAP1_001576 [Malassezia caprae]|uniref:DH domain-containing protein n=1 Tax=Malassezia caprae TaxID=1381934 RepID=A0AAF0E6U8_9BASI|nr:hypothetical protein MCAP1_001576 [Malassezia caprae]
MSVPAPPLDRGEHELAPHSIESVLATPMTLGLKPAAPIRLTRLDTSMQPVLNVSTQASPPYSPSLAMERHDSLESDGAGATWRGEPTQHRTSSPELETDISRTSSTSTKGSQDSAIDSSMALQFVSGINSSAQKDVDDAATRKRVKRLHALLELLETERNYARDLSVLNHVFFKQLRSVPFFSEEPARYQMLVRNGPALLALHTALYTRLSSTVSTLRLGANSERSELERARSDDADEATRAFGRAFTDLAPQFRVYQDFCTKHKESLALLDTAEGRSEWDQFQQRASEAVQRYEDPLLAPTDDADAQPETHKRLYFRDYFIKPIQRICLYPIILQNLVKHVPGVGRAELEAAVECMREVVADVDRASEKRASVLLSEQLLARMEPSEAFSPTFLPSLGDVKMAGNLDVLYHHPTKAPLTTPLAIKYYGCVLFADYFLILKVRKSQTYGPRFWFPMAEVKVTHADRRSVALPQSFRLSVRGHHFEMMTSTAKELELWKHALHTVMEQGPARARRLNGMEVAFPCNLEGSAAPESEGELDPLSLYLSTQSLADSDQGRGRLTHTHSEILLRQKSPPRRAAKDRSMIFSDACISARTSLDTEGTRSHATLISPRVGLHRLSGSEYVSVRIPTSEAQALLRSAPDSLCSSPVTLSSPDATQRTPARRDSAEALPSLSRRSSSALLVPLRATLGGSESETPRLSTSYEGDAPSRSPSMTSLTRHALGRKVGGWIASQRSASATDEGAPPATESEAPSPTLSTTPPWTSYLASARPSAAMRPRSARSSLDAGSSEPGEASQAGDATSPRAASMSRRFAKRFLQLNQLSPMD